MAKKKVWKARAKSMSGQLNMRTLELSAERAAWDAARVDSDSLHTQLEEVRTQLVRTRAELEEMRTAGRCLFSATQGEVDPRSSTPLIEQIVGLQAGLEHGQQHWLSVDPL